ncbi:MAG: hypothetical protein IJF83_06060 [Methanobrevibacter sp.]|nr:hypothetical protein [Methanobrevibacter sp.]
MVQGQVEITIPLSEGSFSASYIIPESIEQIICSLAHIPQDGSKTYFTDNWRVTLQ